MILRWFFDDKLAQASYLVGCAATGEAIVIDPMRDPAPYLAMAKSQGLKITAITETHIHADYLSGSRELAAQTGAKLYLSDEGDADWKYQYASDPNVQLVKDGDVIRIGNLSLRVMHTPGHTPEHISFVLTDHATSEEPHSIFTGDFIFVGDVGRPDLLERAANIQGTMEAGARTLFHTIQQTKSLPDNLMVWPGHGAGSACGKSLGGSPVTTLGYERRSNWAFQIQDESKFVDEVLAGQPDPPLYFKEMKRLNKLGPDILGVLPHIAPVTREEAEAFPGLLVDLRGSAVSRENYYAGSLVIPSGGGLINWAGWLLKFDQPVILIAESQAQANQAARDFAMIGLDVVKGWIEPTLLDSSRFKSFKVTTCDALHEDDFVLDIRNLGEWNRGHLQEATHIPLGRLRERLDEVPRDQRVVVHCAAGGRSPIGVSLLQMMGYDHVVEIPGGMNEIKERCSARVV